MAIRDISVAELVSWNHSEKKFGHCVSWMNPEDTYIAIVNKYQIDERYGGPAIPLVRKLLKDYIIYESPMAINKNEPEGDADECFPRNVLFILETPKKEGV